MSLSEKDVQSLLRVAALLERAAGELRDLAAAAGDASGADAAPMATEVAEKSGTVAPRPRVKAERLPDDFVDRLRSSGRDKAAEQLSTLAHAQLGQILAQMGGSSRDRKRDKDWLIDRILWNLFDFQAGHEIIKGGR